MLADANAGQADAVGQLALRYDVAKNLGMGQQ